MIRESISSSRRDMTLIFKQTEQSPMYNLRHYVGPKWPPTLGAYDYMCALCRRDWSWEGLRRNPRYQDEARSQLITGQATTRLEGGALLTRMHEPLPRAEAWALLSFRRSVANGIGVASNLDAAGRGEGPFGRRRTNQLH